MKKGRDKETGRVYYEGVGALIGSMTTLKTLKSHTIIVCEDLETLRGQWPLLVPDMPLNDDAIKTLRVFLGE